MSGNTEIAQLNIDVIGVVDPVFENPEFTIVQMA